MLRLPLPIAEARKERVRREGESANHRYLQRSTRSIMRSLGGSSFAHGPSCRFERKKPGPAIYHFRIRAPPISAPRGSKWRPARPPGKTPASQFSSRASQHHSPFSLCPHAWVDLKVGIVPIGPLPKNTINLAYRSDRGVGNEWPGPYDIFNPDTHRYPNDSIPEQSDHSRIFQLATFGYITLLTVHSSSQKTLICRMQE